MAHLRRLAQLSAHLSPSTEDASVVEDANCDPCSRLGSRVAAGATAATDAAEWHQQCCAFEPGRLLLGQVAVITGAGSGIGRAAAILFAHHGAQVVVSDLNAEHSQATADFIRNSSGTAMSVPGDVTDPAFPARLVAAALEAYGGLHILVNNAGFTWDSMAHKMSEKQWQAMLDVHCTAPFRLVQAAAPYMREAGKQEMAAGGRPRPRCILNVSSVSGVHGSVGQLNYSTAKMGIVGFTKSLAKEWGPFGVRCNALVYGYINTRLVQAQEKGATIEVDGERVKLGIPQAAGVVDVMKQMIALGRVGAPEEAAGAMLLLASPYASYITGQAIEVTGGGWL